MKRLTRRSFLAASAAFGAGPAFGAPRQKPAPTPAGPAEAPRSGPVDIVVVGAGAAGIAAARRLSASRGLKFVVLEAGQRARRPLHHRQPDVRNSVRSRRALDSCSRHQSAGQARTAGRPGDLSGAARASGCGSAGAMRARANSRTSSRRWCATNTAIATAARGRADIAGREGAAEGPRRMAADDRVRRGAVHLRQGPRPRSRPSISPARSIATTTPTAGRASARC